MYRSTEHRLHQVQFYWTPSTSCTGLLNTVYIMYRSTEHRLYQVQFYWTPSTSCTGLLNTVYTRYRSTEHRLTMYRSTEHRLHQLQVYWTPSTSATDLLNTVYARYKSTEHRPQHVCEFICSMSLYCKWNCECCFLTNQCLSRRLQLDSFFHVSFFFLSKINSLFFMLMMECARSTGHRMTDLTEQPRWNDNKPDLISKALEPNLNHFGHLQISCGFMHYLKVNL